MDAQRNAAEAARQADKFADTQRKLDGAEATERALRLQLKSTESSVFKLKDEMTKMKATVAQNRAACANDVRRRDRQIDSLKRAVVDAGRVRGGNKNRDVVSITVVNEVGVEERPSGVSYGGTDEDGYSLRMETNEFLTELAKGLCEENSTLLHLLRRTVQRLREMSGIEEANAKSDSSGSDATVPPPKNADEMADELEGIMMHLRSMLTNPSFVPIEEVEVREVEIHRLREGWEQMESRWKDAVSMIEGWRKRMAASGKTVNMEELQMGLRLSPVRARKTEARFDDRERHQDLSCVQEEDEEEEDEEEDEDETDSLNSQIRAPERRRSPSPAESLHLVPAPGYDVDEEGSDLDSEQSSIFHDDVDDEELDDEEPNVQILHASTATTIDSPPLPAPPQLSPLKNSPSSGNRRSDNGSRRKRPGDFTTIVEEKTWEIRAVTDDDPPAPPAHGKRTQPPEASLKLSPPRSKDHLKPSTTTSYESPLFGTSIESPLRKQPNRKLFDQSRPGSRETTPDQDSKPEPKVASKSTQSAHNKKSGTKSRPGSRAATPDREVNSGRKEVSKATQNKKSGTKSRPGSRAATPDREIKPEPKEVSKSAQKKKNTTKPDMSTSPAETAKPAPPAKAAVQPAKRTASAPSASTKKDGKAPAPITRSKSTTTSKSRARSPPNTKNKRARSPNTSNTANTARTRSPMRPNPPNPPNPPPSSSRLPRRNGPPPPSPLTMASIAVKLAASEREADAARVRAKLKAARMGRGGQNPAQATDVPSQEANSEDPDVSLGDPVKKDLPIIEIDACKANASHDAGADSDAEEPPPTPKELDIGKRTKRMTRRTSKTVSRRRSTLNPWELESLIQGNLDAESPAR